MLGKNSTKVIFSSAGCSFLLKPILHIKSNYVQQILFNKVGLDSNSGDQIEELNESQMHAIIKNEIIKLLHLLPRNQDSVAQFL